MSEEKIDKKQKLLLEMIISDIEVFSKCIRIIDEKYFEKPLDTVVKTIKEYFSKHHGIPKTDLIEAETGIELTARKSLDTDEIKYTLEEVEEFCRAEAMKHAIMESVDMIHDNNLSAVEMLVRNALRVRIDDSVGISVISDTAQERIGNTIENVDSRGTGIKELDKLLNMTRRGEVGVFFGTTGAGKSVLLGNLGNNYARQGLDVLIISLELKELLYAKRLDAIITNTDIQKHAENASQIQQYYDGLGDEFGSIVVKFLKPQSTGSDIRSVLMDYELKYKKTPDVIIVDYIGLMGATGVKSTQMNKFDFDELKIFELQEIATDYNAFLFTAGQLNRDGADITEITHRHVAGGLSVVNGSDFSVAIVASDEDLDNNQFKLKQLKIRNGARSVQPITMYKSPHSLRISDSPFIRGKDDQPEKASPTKKLLDKNKTKPDDNIDKLSGKEKLNKILKRGI